MRLKNARVEKMHIRMQWNAGTACVSECVLKTLACRGLRVGPSKCLSFPGIPGPGKGGKSLVVCMFPWLFGAQEPKGKKDREDGMSPRETSCTAPSCCCFRRNGCESGMF